MKTPFSKQARAIGHRLRREAEEAERKQWLARDQPGQPETPCYKCGRTDAEHNGEGDCKEWLPF